MAVKRLIAIVIMGMFILISLAVGNSGLNWVTENDFCKICHGSEYKLYNQPGISLDYAHNTHEVSCSGCHEGAGSTGDAHFKYQLGLMLVYDVLGSHPPPVPEDEVDIENKYRCLKCHSNFKQLMEDRLVNPHEDVESCAVCHTGHQRGVGDEACSECHATSYNTLNKEGGKHSKKGCDFCHPQHGYVPLCQTCHGMFHGTSGDFGQCSSCHINSHSPRSIEFEFGTDAATENDTSAEDKSVCGKCHTDQQTIFDMNPTKHAKLECVMCHPTHGEKQQCTNCHEAHDATMTGDDCNDCHTNGHIPTRVIYPSNTSKELCASCHTVVGKTLSDSNTKHSGLECAQCHPKHGDIPTCVSCHKTPHGPALTDCGISCHMSAHDVWRVKG